MSANPCRNWLSLSLAALLCLLLAVVPSCGGATSQSTSTEGLVFHTNADGSLSVIGYEGEETDVIIDTHAGLPIREIGVSAFAESNVTSVTLGASVTAVEVAAFAACESLTEVNAASSALTTVGNAAFLGCSALSLVSLPLSLTSIGVDAFLGCDSLDVLAFGGGGMDWTRVKVGAHNQVLDGIVTLADGTRFDGAFVTGSCTETIQFVLDAEGHLLLTGEGSIPDYTYLEQAPWSDFSDRIRKVTVEGNIDVVGKFAFGRCTSLEEVVLGDSVRLIEDSAFYECYRMTTVTFPANLRRIGSGAFYGCASLSRAVLPDSVTHVGRGAFMNCISLSEVTLGTGITSVEAWTFSGCESLFTVTAAAPVNEVGVGAFHGCPTAITPQE